MGSCENLFTALPEMEKFLCCDRLLDQNQPISERFRALFSLRNLRGPRPRNALIAATRDSSNLLAHEAAFALGQMQDSDAIPALEAVLNDLSLHPIVRHEAAEALGAIGLETNIPLLKNSLVSDPAQEVRETCELALSRIHEFKNVKHCDGSAMIASSPFLSVDPAAPASCSSADQLREVLLDEENSMYERYGALFALRNHGGDKAITAIIESLGAKSALLRHESLLMFHHGIPYPNTKLMTQHVMREIERVLPYLSGWWWVWQTVKNNTLGGSSGCGCGEGRDQKERWERLMEESGFDGYGREDPPFDPTANFLTMILKSIASLGEMRKKERGCLCLGPTAKQDCFRCTIQDTYGYMNEHPMVRHEAAEALGSIADDKSVALLEEFAKDPETIVSQSCDVALSMLEFERVGKSFEVSRLVLHVFVASLGSIDSLACANHEIHDVDFYKRNVTYRII
ncbi:ARM repeat superfamily protein [Actinidia rufa]|uniref:Deoxyhypusine hydroxylase n=1 Tax=Actinidia rufa TaxID=165716 RepID=A0A7J0FTU2_9ERIC|nr:ARM repeat superfamily protein [Actinidia rufa]